MFVLSLIVLGAITFLMMMAIFVLLASYNPFILTGVCGLILLVIALYAPVAIVVRMFKQ